MKKRWIAALLFGAVAVAAGAVLISKKGKGIQEESAWYPTLTGYCGDFDVMSEECNDGRDNPSILRHRGRV